MKSAKRSRGAVLVMAVAGLVLSAANHAAADTIIAPVSGVINAGGPGFGTLTETFNQAGLSAGYTSGVTDFDVYLATDPTHTLAFGGFEWFSELSASSATVTYNLGAPTTINRLALWNEESSGIGLLNLLYSTDNVTFLSLASGLLPTDHPVVDYTADVFAFAPTLAQYVRFEMSNCPQPDGGQSFPACAIGEVAFASGDDGPPVPEPGLIALMGLGLAGVARRLRAQKS